MLKVVKEVWTTGEFFLGVALAVDEWPFELRFIKWILKLKLKPAKREG